jgi:hypothetical protein
MPITVSRCGPTPRELVSFRGRASGRIEEGSLSREIVRNWRQCIILLMLMELQPITSK